jgi:hypothetical protein
MTRTFVAVDDPIHNLIRDLTRRLPLRLTLAEDGPDVEHQFDALDLPEKYYSLAVFHSLQGLAVNQTRLDRWRVCMGNRSGVPDYVNYFDVVNLDRRCFRDVRWKLRKRGPGMVAADLLAHGVGALRARNDDPGEPLFGRLWDLYGRLHSRKETVYARIRTLHMSSVPLLAGPQKESFDSTNMIYGDAHGELLQLWDRRADIRFLDGVAEALQRMRDRAEIAAYIHPPLNLPTMIRMHLRCQSVWRVPPADGRSLLKRVDYLLNRLVVDDAPKTWHSLQGLAGKSHPGAEEDGSSGYDGWLPGEDTGIH